MDKWIDGSYWANVLQEVRNKNNPECFFAYTPFAFEDEDTDPITPIKSRPKKEHKPGATALGESCDHQYFTKRESEVMHCVLEGKTQRMIADQYELSPRTIEFYLENMKKKVGARRRAELIRTIMASDFLENSTHTRSSRKKRRPS